MGPRQTVLFINPQTSAGIKYVSLYMIADKDQRKRRASVSTAMFTPQSADCVRPLHATYGPFL